MCHTIPSTGLRNLKFLHDPLARIVKKIKNLPKVPFTWVDSTSTDKSAPPRRQFGQSFRTNRFSRRGCISSAVVWRRTKSRQEESASCERSNRTHCISSPGKNPFLWKGPKTPRPPPEPTSQPASQPGSWAELAPQINTCRLSGESSTTGGRTMLSQPASQSVLFLIVVSCLTSEGTIIIF